MKKSVAITAVLALHIGVISMLLVQAGCSSEPEAPAAKAKTATEEVTTIAPAEQKEADASVRDAELPPEGSPALRVAPTRPAWNMGKSAGAGETLVPEASGEPEKAEPAKPAAKPAKPADETENIYVVRKGDNLSAIAKKHRVTVSELMAINGLSRSSVIRIGQEIKIPASGEVSTLPEPQPAEHANAQISSETETYVVKSGDSLSRIAKKYSTTVRQLMSVNNLKNHNIKVGQKLLVAKGSPAKTAKAAAPAAAAADGEISYEIKSGDTLGAIARKHGTSVSAICKRNGVSDPRKIRVGQKIVLPVKAAKPSQAQAQPAQKAEAPAQPAQPAANPITVTADAPKASAQQPAAESAAPAPSASPVQPAAPAQPAAPEAETIPVIEI